MELVIRRRWRAPLFISLGLRAKSDGRVASGSTAERRSVHQNLEAATAWPAGGSSWLCHSGAGLLLVGWAASHRRATSHVGSGESGRWQLGGAHETGVSQVSQVSQAGGRVLFDQQVATGRQHQAHTAIRRGGGCFSSCPSSEQDSNAAKQIRRCYAFIIKAHAIASAMRQAGTLVDNTMMCTPKSSNRHPNE